MSIKHRGLILSGTETLVIEPMHPHGREVSLKLKVFLSFERLDL